jgi:hypothetical protein
LVGFLGFWGTGSCCVPQAGLKLSIFLPQSLRAVITDVSHHAWKNVLIPLTILMNPLAFYSFPPSISLLK